MPRIALLSDIHGNLEAMRAVLHDVAHQSPDLIACLGDVVGYGPDPGVCVEMVREACDTIVQGNHDEAALAAGEPTGFNLAAANSIRYTRGILGPLHHQEMRRWPTAATHASLAIAHGSFGPNRFDYLVNKKHAWTAFAHLTEPFGAVGHTHLPSLFVLPEDGTVNDVKWFQPPAGTQVRLPRGAKCIVNPGSVGQPRDRNPDASWALLDTDKCTFQLRRVAYDITAVEEKIRAAGLPEFLGERLKVGA